jgi:multidrug resistance efflux pump
MVDPQDNTASLPSIPELMERLGRFQGPPQAFLTNLLAVQCHLVSAAGGAILRPGGSGSFDVLAVWPLLREGQTAPSWLAHASEAAGQVMQRGQTTVQALHDAADLYGAEAGKHLVLVPLRQEGDKQAGIAAFCIESGDIQFIGDSKDKLELTASLLSLYEMRIALQRRQNDLRRLRQSMEVLAVVNEQRRFQAMAMSLCNDLASRWECDRASIGFLKGRYVKLKAMSHTEKFSRKMQVVQDIESAMEECLDQDQEILVPASDEATYVARCAQTLSSKHGPTSVLSIPLRVEGEPVAVVTLERPVDMPFVSEDIESLRLGMNLITPQLTTLHTTDRWFGARWAGRLKKGLGLLIGPKHTWAKLAAVGLIGLICFMTLVKGQYSAQGDFALETVERAVVSSPFDGSLKEIRVEPGDPVKKNDILGILETDMLEADLAMAEAREMQYRVEADIAQRDGKEAERKIKLALADKEAASAAKLRLEISKATLRSPIEGVVVSEDLNRIIGLGSVEIGNPLFEVAPLEALQAEILIPEDMAGEIKKGQRGELAVTSYPDQHIGFEVERVWPVAQVVDQKNVFRVRVKLDEDAIRPWMRPGLEGSARIHISKMPYGQLWTRKMIHWIRMRLWI